MSIVDVSEVHAVCVNLDSRPDRWEAVTGQFDQAGLTVTRRPGVPRDTIDPADVAAYRRRAKRRIGPVDEVRAPGDVACLRALGGAVAELAGHGGGLLFEDDVVLDDDFVAKANRTVELANLHKPGWLAINFGAWHWEPPIVEVPGELHIIRGCWAAHAVLWSEHGAKAMAREAEKEQVPFDETWRPLVATRFMLAPATLIAWQADGWSDLRQRQFTAPPTMKSAIARRKQAREQAIAKGRFRDR